MIIEHAVLTIEPGREDEFEAVFDGQARHFLAKSPGFISVRLSRGIERPGTYLLLVEWERIEDHLDGFRNSELFEQWRSVTHTFFAEPAAVEHYSPKV
jgi:heme-degrading monooxygenase HmoA